MGEGWQDSGAGVEGETNSEAPEPPVTGKQQRIFPDSAVFREKPSRKQLRIQ